MSPRIILSSVFISWLIVFGYFASISHAETITTIATQMVGKPVKVHCVSMKDMYGYTLQETVAKTIYNTFPVDGGMQTDTDTVYEQRFQPDIYLSRGTCVGISALKSHRIYSRYLEANALETLIHEANHIRLNSSNESMVECKSMLKFRFWVKLFGYNDAMNRSLISKAWIGHWRLGPNYTQTGYGCDYQGTTYIHMGPVKKPNA